MTKTAHSDEEAGIYRRIAEGDMSARNDMMIRHIGLAQAAATYYAKRNPHLDADDLFQEGRIGIIRALNKFDVDRGFRFSTYAMFWVKKEIQRYILANHSVVSSSKKDADAYTSGSMDAADVQLYDIRCISNQSIDDPMPSGDSFDEVFPDPDSEHIEEIAEHSFEWARLKRVLSSANGAVGAEHRAVLCMKFGVLGHERSNVAQIAKQVGCPEQDVPRIASEALEMLTELIVQDASGIVPSVPVVELWVAGRPKGKDRARTTKTGHTFTPKATINAEANVVSAWRESGELRIPEEAGKRVRIPVKMDVLILVERPSSHFNARKELNAEGLRHPQPENQKPDVDNALKLIMDAMNGRAYKDDVKVVTSTQRRRWSRSRSGVLVTIQPETEEGDLP